LTRQERSLVKRAVLRGEKVKGRRLQRALVSHAQQRLAHHDRIELLQALVVAGAAVGLMGLLGLALGAPVTPGMLLGAGVGFVGGAYLFARPRRRRLYEQALARHGGAPGKARGGKKPPGEGSSRRGRRRSA
jgi:hypothetical protein